MTAAQQRHQRPACLEVGEAAFLEAQLEILYRDFGTTAAGEKGDLVEERAFRISESVTW